MSDPRPEPEQLLVQNQAWAASIIAKDPNFFKKSAEGQSPKVLWIGCSDSRCPESVITAALPGDIFVQRNIANQVHLDDPNAVSVIQYAVEHVEVKHIIVVGHTKCGGVETCYKIVYEGYHVPGPPLSTFLAPLVQLAKELDLGGKPRDEALAILTKENVLRQVDNVVHAISGMEHGNKVTPLGWIYKIEEGLLGPIVPLGC